MKDKWHKNPPAMQVTHVRPLGQEDPLEKGDGHHFVPPSFLLPSPLVLSFLEWPRVGKKRFYVSDWIGEIIERVTMIASNESQVP